MESGWWWGVQWHQSGCEAEFLKVGMWPSNVPLVKSESDVKNT